MQESAPGGGRNAGIAVLLVLGIALAWTDVLEQPAADYLERALVRAGTAYVSARGLNAAISVIQESELELSPVGFGVSVAAGQVLDPVNDLVEQFSSVMLVASTSLIVQRVLLEVARWSLVRWTLTLAGLLMVILVLAGSVPRRGMRGLAFRVVAGMLLARFLVPVTVLLGSQLSRRFVESSISDHGKALEEMHATARDASDQLTRREKLEETLRQGQAESGGVWATVRDGFFSTARNVMDAVDIGSHVKRVQESGTRAIQAMLHLLALFLLETVIFPIGLLWILTRLARAAVSE